MKRIISILIIFSLLAFGCSATESQKKIYDNEKKLISSMDSHTYEKNSKNINLNNGTNKFENFTGMDTMWEIKGSGILKVEYSGECTKGKLKLVLVKIDDSVMKDLPLEGEYENTFEVNLEEGKYALKLAGIEAGGVCNINLKIDGELIIKDRS